MKITKNRQIGKYGSEITVIKRNKLIIISLVVLNTHNKAKIKEHKQPRIFSTNLVEKSLCSQNTETISSEGTKLLHSAFI